MECSCWCLFGVCFCGPMLHGVRLFDRGEVFGCMRGALRIFSRCITHGSTCQSGLIWMVRKNTWVYLFLRNGFDSRKSIGVCITKLQEARWSNSGSWMIKWPLKIAGLLSMATPHACWSVMRKSICVPWFVCNSILRSVPQCRIFPQKVPSFDIWSWSHFLNIRIDSFRDIV